MNRIHIFLLVSVTACSLSRGRGPGSDAATASGAVAADATVSLDAGVADVRLTVGGAGDSVRWSLTTDPPGCARADISGSRIRAADRARTCSMRWEMTAPGHADLEVSADVGDIDVTAPADRSIRLKSGVGSVRLRLDDRELRHDGAPGSGDELSLGSMDMRPRIDARTGVGSVSAMLWTRPPG